MTEKCPIYNVKRKMAGFKRLLKRISPLGKKPRTQKFMTFH